MRRKTDDPRLNLFATDSTEAKEINSSNISDEDKNLMITQHKKVILRTLPIIVFLNLVLVPAFLAVLFSEYNFFPHKLISIIGIIVTLYILFIRIKEASNKNPKYTYAEVVKKYDIEEKTSSANDNRTIFKHYIDVKLPESSSYVRNILINSEMSDLIKLNDTVLIYSYGNKFNALIPSSYKLQEVIFKDAEVIKIKDIPNEEINETEKELIKKSVLKESLLEIVISLIIIILCLILLLSFPISFGSIVFLVPICIFLNILRLNLRDILSFNPKYCYGFISRKFDLPSKYYFDIIFPCYNVKLLKVPVDQKTYSDSTKGDILIIYAPNKHKVYARLLNPPGSEIYYK